MLSHHDTFIERERERDKQLTMTFHRKVPKKHEHTNDGERKTPCSH